MSRKYRSSSTKFPSITAVVVVGICCMLFQLDPVEANASPDSQHCTDVATTADLRVASINHHNGTELRELSPAQFFAQLREARVVVIGETHDNRAHHLAQLEIICRLVTGGGDKADENSWMQAGVGFEQFQRSAQRYLDAFVSGDSSIEQLLNDSSYFSSWGYDFRLYEPILTWAANRGMALLALNASAELVELVRAEGLDSLNSEDGDKLPFEPEPVSDAYRQRLRQIFDQHAAAASTPGAAVSDTEPANFQRFIDVQRTWEGTMTATALAWLDENTASNLIILVGAGHMLWSETLPDQLRNNGINGVVSVAMDIDRYVSDSPESNDEESVVTNVDYSLSVSSKPLSENGKLGVALETRPDGVFVTGFSPQSAAEAAGILVGDRLGEINGQVIHSYAEVRQLLWKSPVGEAVDVRVAREGVSEMKLFSFSLK